MKNPKPPPKGSSHKPSSSSTPSAAGGAGAVSRKSRWESDHPPSDPQKPSPKPSHPKDDHPRSSSSGAAAAGVPQPPPPYGFHNLERRTIVLADGSVRSYFALPPDYPLEPPPRPGDPHAPLGFPFDKRFPPPPGGPRFGSPDDFREPPPHLRRPHDGPQHDYWASLGLDGPREGGAPSSLKRKYGEDDGFAWHRQSVLQYGNPNLNPRERDRGEYYGRGGHDDYRLPKQVKLEGEGSEDLPPSRRGRHEEDVAVGANVDKQALKKAFLTYVKLINENVNQRKNYLDNGRSGPLKCIVCGRASKEYADLHGLVMHAFSPQIAESLIEHLGLHKALCVLMGWNFAKAPENSKVYQSLSPDDAASNREDLIMWPPTVIIHNTNTGRRKDGRMDGMGNKEMDIRLKELGFGGGKSKSMYGKEGHMGVTMVKFANTQAGLKEAERLAEYFEKEGHGRRGWARASQTSGADEVRVDEKSDNKRKILYGHLATASDFDKVDSELRKRVVIKSRKDLDLSD